MPLNSKKYKAVIIGAGRIAATFDDPKSKTVLTHAHAFKKHPKVELVGFYDTDYKKAQNAAKQWSAQAFKNWKEIEQMHPDIVSVCTPDKYHFRSLLEVLKLNPKLVIVEKPLTTNLKDSEKIITQYQKEKIPVLVNYSRRFDPVVQKIKRELDQKKYGKVLVATAVYSKGVMHNGSHMLDLARYFFGEVKDTRPLFSQIDYEHKFDPTVGGFLSFTKCPQFYLAAADERRYSIFELDILCEKGRLRFVDSGQSVIQQETISDPQYAGYTILGKEKLRTTGLSWSMINMIDNAIKYLDHKQPLLSDLKNAYKTQLVSLQLLKK